MSCKRFTVVLDPNRRILSTELADLSHKFAVTLNTIPKQYNTVISTGPKNFSTTLDTKIREFSVALQTGRSGKPGPPGPPGVAGGETLAIFGTNVSGQTIVAGMAVAMSPTGTGFVLASYSNVNRQGVGVVKTGAAHGSDLEVVILGVVEVDDWSPSTGAAWLPPNTKLWLLDGGTLATSPSATAGQYHQSLGAVWEPQKLIVNPSRILIMQE